MKQAIEKTGCLGPVVCCFCLKINRCFQGGCLIGFRRKTDQSHYKRNHFLKAISVHYCRSKASVTKSGRLHNR